MLRIKGRAGDRDRAVTEDDKTVASPGTHGRRANTGLSHTRLYGAGGALTTDESISRTVRDLVLHAGYSPIMPTALDHFVFLCGVPIGPWIRPRPPSQVWSLWFGALRESVLPLAGADMRTARRSPATWETWADRHIHTLRFRTVWQGIAHLLECLETLPVADGGGVHLIGHSAGGAASLAYLLALQANLLNMPRLPIRTVITLDAAVSGLAGTWTGMQHFRRYVVGADFRDLGPWAREHSISVLTIANRRDVWSHKALGTIPYLGLSLGPALAFRSHFDGTIHEELRSAPQLIQAVWAIEPSALLERTPAMDDDL
jgi:pimeloyl-ACP methyl ester carboxylesterase